MKIYIISDLHLDYKANLEWLNHVLYRPYQGDILLLAGDISHNYQQIKRELKHIRSKFKKVFFTPGNHDLWIHNHDWTDSLEKFKALMEFCESEDVTTKREDILINNKNIRIIPLHAWYTEPGQGDDHLYWPKPGEDKSNRMWSDNVHIQWPANERDFSPVKYFLALTEENNMDKKADLIITMSHFLPREEMMFSEFPPKVNPEIMKKYDRNPLFNFSRVAGSNLIENKLRGLKSNIHVYGHQHINRDRVIEGVRYISHCLGYPSERRRGLIQNIGAGLKIIFDSDLHQNGLI
ncbi:MAG: metallophosphoesterase [Calditrichaceae bacterium]|nr:metallophosphoesterase [Calditrichaceae bacterium]MBN2708656.1 metallophosphoesterase [Calditrichaceae bacterium]RQV92008.1 MAG: hypothetical protein EH224_16535 [Calditrichota bacterium]